jgi:hypothetical protein
MISERTKAGLRAAKDRGKKLGGLRTTPEQHAEISVKGREAAVALRCQREERESHLRPVIDEIKASGAEDPARDRG